MLCDICDKTLINQNEVIIVSGKANGADSLGEKYAKLKGYKVLEMPADWDKYGKSAGYIRNKEMAKIADGAIIFWDGKSKGSKHMIDLSNEYNLKIKIKYY